MGLPSLNNSSILSKVDLKDKFSVCQSDSENYYNDWLTTGWVGKFNLDLILSEAIKKKASDIHIVGGQHICFSILGDIEKQYKYGIPDDDVMSDIVIGMLSHTAQSKYNKNLEYDTSYSIRFGPYKGRRFRANIGKSFDLDQITFRVISDSIPNPSDLGINNEILELFNSSSGIILTCGATGSGKTTSLASIIRDIQMNRKIKIITIEKPVEYIYPEEGKSLIVQRDIPRDCLSFYSGLTSAMRADPDVILIGEVRNKEEVDELLRSSETGHLSLSTVHSSNNITTLNRIRSLYGGDEQRRILNTLGDNLRGIINQTLVKTKNGEERFAVREILIVNHKIRRLIAEDKFSEIRDIQERAELTMEHELVRTVLSGKCHLKEARDKAPDFLYFDEIYNTKTKQKIKEP